MKCAQETGTLFCGTTTGLFHINSRRLLDYWIRYINGDTLAYSDEEKIMRNMLYYTFYKKHPGKYGFKDIDEGNMGLKISTKVSILYFTSPLSEMKFCKYWNIIADILDSLPEGTNIHMFVHLIYIADIIQTRSWRHTEYLQKRSRQNSGKV